jgi:hypothetical protein
MKHLLTLAILLGTLGTIFGGQGTVLFNNYDSDARVFDQSTGQYASGPGYRVALYSQNPTTGIMEQQGGFATFDQDGYFDGGTRTISNLPADGGIATLQMRVWKEAETFESSTLRGESNIWQNSTANPNSAPPGTPEELQGVQPFAIVIPEPSTIGLGILGLSTMLMRRRKAKVK